MKKISLLLSLFILSFAAPSFGQETPTPPVLKAPPTGPTTTVDFEETTANFGKIVTGDKVQYVFKFKNTGDIPYVISNAKGSCGCTVPEWPKEPIMPGEKGEILVQFDSKGKSGHQSKTVTITGNTNPPQMVITLKGEVLQDEASPTIGLAGSPSVKIKEDKPAPKQTVASSDLLLFPNPVSTTLQVKASSFAGKSVDVQILNEKGQVVGQKKVNEMPLEAYQYNVGDLSPGIYTISLKDKSGKTISGKFTIAE